jgi:hypothetical protein
VRLLGESAADSHRPQYHGELLMRE